MATILAGLLVAALIADGDLLPHMCGGSGKVRGKPPWERKPSLPRTISVPAVTKADRYAGAREVSSSDLAIAFEALALLHYQLGVCGTPCSCHASVNGMHVLWVCFLCSITMVAFYVYVVLAGGNPAPRKKGPEPPAEEATPAPAES